MIRTKLVLIEGPPGSGKSTTARLLAAEITQSGKDCQWFGEWSENHPLPIGGFNNLGAVISSSGAREPELLRLWQQFAEERQAAERVTILESRFWQTSVMLMYAVGYPLDAVLESNQHVIEAVQGLQPVLIYFAIDELRLFITQIIEQKNAEWQRSNFPGTWIAYILEALENQPWFTQRGLSGLEGMHAFFEEWAEVTQELYRRVPFPKIKIRNPHRDWAAAMQQMRDFLDLPA